MYDTVLGHHVIGLSIKETIALKVGDTLTSVFENGPRPTGLTAIVTSLPQLEDNPYTLKDYYCNISVEGVESKCRLTHANIWGEWNGEEPFQKSEVEEEFSILPGIVIFYGEGD